MRTFVCVFSARSLPSDISVSPQAGVLASAFPQLLRLLSDFANEKAGSMGRQLLAFVRGTQNALCQNGVPYMSITCERCDLFNWG